MTSFKGVKLVDKGFSPDFRRRQLPVSPAEPHPDHGMLLHLHDGRKMHKNTYVNTYSRYEVHFEHLERYQGGLHYFTEECLQTIIEMSGFTAPSRSPHRDGSRISNSRFVEQPTQRRLVEGITTTNCFEYLRKSYTEEEMRSYNPQRSIKISATLVQTLQTLGIFKNHDSTPDDIESRPISTPTPSLSSSVSSRSRSFALVPGSSPALPGPPSLPLSSRPATQSTPYAYGGSTPLPFSDPVNTSQASARARSAASISTYYKTSPPPHSCSAFQSTSYAYGGITPLPFSDPVYISRPAPQPRPATSRPRHSENSPLLPVYTQDVQGQDLESEQRPTTSNVLDVGFCILISSFLLITGVYYWMKPAGGG
jgi:hypothetical protein